MRIIKENHSGLSTLLSFALIPLSGLATDIYIPSLPSMATDLHTSSTAVQASIVLFMISGGISQLFVGSLLDSFGRFRLGIASLILFAMASFVIALSGSINVIYAMRLIQGFTVATIVVGKRAYFVDIYSGDRLKNYVSMFSIIWATAPIIAPFLGGYLQSVFGWRSNFYFLGIFALSILVLELIYSGESLRNFQQFKLKPIANVYATVIKTTDFTLALFILAACYSMLVVFGMTGPFIIEHVYHLSPVTTGYCALLSGVALMTGGMISKSMISKPLTRKIFTAIGIQLCFAITMIITADYGSSLYTLMPFVIIIHLISGFVFNSFFSYCLGRFSKNAGIAAGITGGGMFILASFFSYGIVNIISIKNQALLGTAYLTLSFIALFVFALFFRVKYPAIAKLSKAF